MAKVAAVAPATRIPPRKFRHNAGKLGSVNSILYAHPEEEIKRYKVTGTMSDIVGSVNPFPCNLPKNSLRTAL
jgi:hypothetical protein